MDHTFKRDFKRCLLIGVFFFLYLQAGYAQESASFFIRQKLEMGGVTSSLKVGNEQINQPQLLVSFYSRNGYALAWHSHSNVMDLLVALLFSSEEGLNPKDYHFDILQTYTAYKESSAKDLANRDLLFTDAFFSYGNDLLRGKIDPELLYPGKWKVEKRNAELVPVLEDALSESQIRVALDVLKPALIDYTRLKDQLMYFRQIQSQGGWSKIPEGPSLVPGDSSNSIPIIKKRLVSSGQLQAQYADDGVVYDSVLESAIKEIQTQHGLTNDGVIGTQTRKALNLTAESYIDKIIVNLERIRWLPWNLGEKYVWVNLPDFQLKVMERDSLAMNMKAIVGRSDRATPVFSSTIRYLIVNPTWTVPPTILKEDILPAIKRDIHYLDRHNLHLINKRGEEVDPTSLDWSTLTEKKFPYHIRQDPGLYNSMGLIKFQFPNHYGVFLHDTNARYLFNDSYRALSSGCIRIQFPFELAVNLLQGTKWKKEKLEKEISSGKTTTIIIKDRIQIHLQYLTTYVDGRGIFQWREDIYALDGPLLSAIHSSAK